MPPEDKGNINTMPGMLKGCVSQPLNLVVKGSPPKCLLRVLARALQECSERLHLGPYGPLSVSFGMDGDLCLLRLRAGDTLQGVAELAEWRLLWDALLPGNPSTLTAGDRVRRKCQLVDGHGRLLVTCASLLRQLLLPEARYPVLSGPSSHRNRLRLLQVLRKLTTPGELRNIPVGATGEENHDEGRMHHDAISRMTHACLRILQPCSHSASMKVTRKVLEGCIHFNMCTEVEDDVLKTIRQLLMRFLWNSQVPGGSVTTRSIVDRTRDLLIDPVSCIVSCVGHSILSSCCLPSDTLLFPTVVGGISVHQGTATPLFAMESPSSKKCHRVLLLRIDSKGGLLDFAHSSVLQTDSEGGSDMGESTECRREVQHPWTATELEEAQCKAAQALYEWAWTHDVDVILTPSHVPPVIKTFGVRYSNVCNSGSKERMPIIMVDQMEESVFDAMLRRLQRWYGYRDSTVNDNKGVLTCPVAAVLRFGHLELPENPGDCFVSCIRVVHSPISALFTSAKPSVMTMEWGDSVRVVLLELCHDVPRESPVGCVRGWTGAGLMILTGSTSGQLNMYTKLILKCAAAVLKAVDAFPCEGADPEAGLGFVRAGGALQIAMARQMHQSADALKRTMQGRTASASLLEEVSVVSAVLHVLSEALLEVPRRLASHFTAHHHPMRRMWLRLEGDEMRVGNSPPLRSLTPASSPQPLHLFLRDDPSIYQRAMRPASLDAGVGDDDSRRYFCCSDTESDESESDDGSGKICGSEEVTQALSFVEPVATTTSVIRCAITLVRLVLSSEAAAWTSEKTGVTFAHSLFHSR